MKYMLLIYLGEDSMSETEREHCYVESAQLCHDLQSRGQYLGANPLQPVSTATTVRVRNGEAQLSDGPFAEIKEQLGGYYILDCADLDAALRYAAMIPSAKYGSVEVRPVMVMGPH